MTPPSAPFCFFHSLSLLFVSIYLSLSVSGFVFFFFSTSLHSFLSHFSALNRALSLISCFQITIHFHNKTFLFTFTTILYHTFMCSAYIVFKIFYFILNLSIQTSQRKTKCRNHGDKNHVAGYSKVSFFLLNV